MLAGLYAGPASDGAVTLAPLQEAGGARPIADFSGRRPYLDVQRGFDALYPDGRQYYWSSLFLDDLTDDALRAALDSAAARPSPLSAIAFWQLDGAIDRLPPEATAYEHRGARYLLGVEANWDEVNQEARRSNVAWVKDCIDSVLPFSTRGQCVNLASAHEKTYSSSVVEKLGATQSTYDPLGLFAER